ncbi:MAG TPA: FadR/GntR family transcriptional regulator [Tepidisphaeraceae bacterium]
MGEWFFIASSGKTEIVDAQGGARIQLHRNGAGVWCRGQQLKAVMQNAFDACAGPTYTSNNVSGIIVAMTSGEREPIQRRTIQRGGEQHPPASKIYPPGVPRGGPALVEQVVRHLRGKILSGELAVGADLPPEATIGVTLGVSRTVVREAMRVMRAQGLVQVSQGRQPRVLAVDPQTAVDGLTLVLQRSDSSLDSLVELRRPIESEIAFLAAERASADSIHQMSASIQDLLQATTLEERVLADMQFHMLLAESTGNLLFVMVLQSIWGLLRKSRLLTMAQSSVDVPASWHERILTAVKQRNGVLAKDERLQHINASALDLERIQRG